MTEYQRTVMPFGKHKGEFLGDIPKAYLLWLLENTDIKQPLKQSVKKTYEMLERSGG